MDIKKAEYISKLLMEMNDFAEFKQNICKGTNVSEYCVINIDLRKDGKYYPESIRMHSYTLLDIVNRLHDEKRKELKELK